MLAYSVNRKSPLWGGGGGAIIFIVSIVSIELPCTYYIYGPKLHKKYVHDSLRQNRDELSSVL